MKKTILYITLTLCLLLTYAPNVMSWDPASLPYVIQKSAPAVTDDSYVVPYLWFDSVTDLFYLLSDNSTGAATWAMLSVSGGAGAFSALTVTDNIETGGGQIVNVTTVAAATYDLLVTDYILNVTYTGTAAVTSLTLMTAQTVAGRIIHIKDAGGNATTNNITVDTEGSETIDGSATLSITTSYNAVTLYCDGSDWFIM